MATNVGTPIKHFGTDTPSGLTHKSARLSSALLFPLLATAVQHLLWAAIRPFAWILFYPAVFLSSWIGGTLGGVMATLVSAVLVWWSFVPPEHTLAKDEPRYVLAAAVFVLVGTLFSVFQGRLRRTTQRLSDALDATRAARDSLRESEANLKRAQEVAQTGSWDLDVSKNRLAWSDEAFRIFGMPSGTPLTYETFLSAVHPGDRESVDRAWKSALLGSAYDIEHRIIVEDKLRWVRERAELEFDARGNPLRGIGTVQDITERKLAQERLLQTNRANRALSKCNQVLIRAVQEGALLQQICDIVVQEAGYKLCWVGRCEHDELKSVRVIAQSGWESGYLGLVDIRWADTERGRGPTGTCIRTGTTITTKDIATDPAMAPWRTEALKRGYGSILAVPLTIDSEVFGAMTIYAAEADAFGKEEVELLTELVSDLAFGIATLHTRAERDKAEQELRALNAELEQRVSTRTAELQQAREREFDVGYRIQQALLLDRPPEEIAGLRIAALTIPSQRIDGDFYIFIEPREACVDLIVGDVMGKGIPAALLGAATKAHFLKAFGQLSLLYPTAELPEPGKIVNLAHAEIVRHLIDLESFVTLCYARIDATTGSVQLVDCGHTGIIIRRQRTGLTEVLHGDNLPLGVREGEIYNQFSLECESGDLLLFFSDGVTEARNPAGELFGVERLQDCVRISSHLAPTAMVEKIRQAVVGFCGSDQLNDDLTSVVIRLEQVTVPLAQAELEIHSDLQQLHRAREFVRSFCSGLPVPLLDEEAVGAMELAVDEAASNVMKHAYRGVSDRRIYLRAEAFPERIMVQLRDDGDPFDPATGSPTVPDGARESGAGLYILRHSVDQVTYRRDKCGRNCLTLVKFSKTHSENKGEAQWTSTSIS
jgi:PAS domain S-box-containing protein